MTWVKGPNGIATWDGGPWPTHELAPEGTKRPRGRPRSAKHGTDSGYARHLRDKEVACDACVQAHREYARSKSTYSRKRANA